MEDIQERVAIGRELIARGISEDDLALVPAPAPPGPLARHLLIPFSDGLAPTPVPIAPAPDPGAPLPAAEVVVITWTVDEQDALCDVFTPGLSRSAWYRYTRNFPDYASRIRAGAPAATAQRLGSYFPSTIGATRARMKSELHLNQDGVKTGEGTATLPVKDFFLQIIKEAQPTRRAHRRHGGRRVRGVQLGDVVVTRGAKFRLATGVPQRAVQPPGVHERLGDPDRALRRG